MQECNDETEGRQGTQGVGVQGTPAIFIISHMVLTSNVQEGGFAPRVAYRRNEQHRCDRRGETPSRRVSFHTDVTRGSPPPPVVFPSTQVRREGVLLLPSCFLPHGRDRRGETPYRCVSFHTDATRGGLPLPAMFSSNPSTQKRREGRVSFHIDATRSREGVLLLPLCFLHDERGETHSRCVSFHTDATRGGSPPRSIF
jgi:hypothetical protein